MLNFFKPKKNPRGPGFLDGFFNANPGGYGPIKLAKEQHITD